MLINDVELKIEPCAYLDYADLRGADLRGANLCYTNLRGANLGGADLHDANLHGANLCYANLENADLRGADLENADLHGANLRGANLRGADLHDADLYGTGLHGAKNIPQHVYDQTLITPVGDLVGYKKLKNGIICKLLIPADAKRHNATRRKCRAEYAVVLEGEGFSQYDESFIYKVGETMKPTKPFDEDRWNECSTGIHFFLTREEAEEY